MAEISSDPNVNDANREAQLADVQASADAAFDKEFDAVLSDTPPSSDAPPAEPPQPPGQAPAEPPAQSSPDPQAQAAGSTPPTPAGSSLSAGTLSPQVATLIAKYGGQIDNPATWTPALTKAADEFYEASRQNAAYQRAIQEAEAEPEQGQAQAPPLSVDSQQYESRLLELDGSFKALDADYSELKAKRNSTNDEIEALQGEIREIEHDIRSGSEPSLEDSLRSELASKQRQLRQKQSRIGNLDTRLEQIRQQALGNRREHEQVTERKALSDQIVELRQSRQAEALEKRTTEITGYRNTWHTSLASVAAAKGIPKEVLEDFLGKPGDSTEVGWARAQALIYLQSNPNVVLPQDPAGIQKYQEQLADRYMAMLDRHHRARSSQYSDTKLKDAALNTSGGGQAAAPDTKPLRSIKDWEEFHETVDLSA